MMYFKILEADADGKFQVIQVDPSLFNLEGLLNDLYVSKGWAVATQAEYEATLPVEAAEVVDAPAVEEAPAE